MLSISYMVTLQNLLIENLAMLGGKIRASKNKNLPMTLKNFVRYEIYLSTHATLFEVVLIK